MVTAPAPEVDLSRQHQLLAELDPMRCSGRVVQVIGLTVEAVGLSCQLGEICEIVTNSRRRTPARSAEGWSVEGGERAGEPMLAEVVGFRDDRVLLMALGEMNGIAPG